jgi:hypothetical protein
MLMSDKMVTLATFSNPVEAELVRAELEGEGIRAVLLGDTSGGLFAGMGAGLAHVQLLVPEGDRNRAAKLVDALMGAPEPNRRKGHERKRRRRKKRGTAIKAEGPPTPSPTEIQPAAKSPVHAAPPATAPAPTPEEGEEPEPALGPPDDEEEGGKRSILRTPDDFAHRALLASFLGVFCCVLNLYSLWLLISLPFVPGHLTTKGTIKAYSALVLNLIVWAFLLSYPRFVRILF